MGSELDIVQGWRNEIEGGQLLGPRIYTSGPMLDGPKPRFPSSVAIATPEDAHRAVADLKRRGAEFIKLQSLIPREAVFAIVEEAKKQESRSRTCAGCGARERMSERDEELRASHRDF